MNTDRSEENRRLIEGIFAELEGGNRRPFVDALADDVSWTTPGKSVWSQTFAGKTAVLDELLGWVRAQLVESIRLKVRRVLADDDRVVVEATGQAATKKGKPYANEYCFIFRIAGGKVAEVTEYCDTDLACSALEPPARAGGANR